MTPFHPLEDNVHALLSVIFLIIRILLIWSLHLGNYLCHRSHSDSCWSWSLIVYHHFHVTCTPTIRENILYFKLFFCTICSHRFIIPILFFRMKVFCLLDATLKVIFYFIVIFWELLSWKLIENLTSRVHIKLFSRKVVFRCSSLHGTPPPVMYFVIYVYLFTLCK